MTIQSFCLVLLFLIYLATPLTATAQIVDIPDPNLRAVIEWELGKARGATITVADMAMLTELLASNANISNVTGLEAATNLKTLNLGAKSYWDDSGNSNRISDLSPLAGLTNLTELRLRKTAISDISAIEGLTNLEVLNLGSNSISDLSPIADLTNLTHLSLYENFITDISAIEGLTNLELLDLSDNSIFDISAIEGLNNLEVLDLGDNSISDISAIGRLNNLTSLGLYRNSISDISAIEGLNNLTILGLVDNSISDISPLVANTGLGSGAEVDLGGNPLNTESINTHVPALQRRGVTVHFYYVVVPREDTTQTVDIPDPNLRAVIEWELRKAPGDTVTVADMATLTKLFAPNARISDLTGLEHATNLTFLNLGAVSGEGFIINTNSISDLSPLMGLNNLKQLNLSNNFITDIAPLAGLTNLTLLMLWNNSISDLSPLVANTGLGSEDFVDVKGNPLDSLSLNTHIPTLQSRGVTVEFDDIRVRPEDLVQIVDIPDANLRAVIAHTVGKAPGATITVADMVILTEFFAAVSNIIDLTGLEAATNLTSLELAGNNISDISALERLTQLTQLGLGGNSISDISALVGLTQLRRLDLSLNSISDLSSLVENTGIGFKDHVNIKGNFLNAESINTHIPELQSRGVWVEFDNVIVQPEDIAQTVDIPDPNLRSRIESKRGKAPGTPITIADMLVLTELSARNSNISDLTGLEYATNLTELDLNHNNITDISPLAGLTHLAELRLHRNLISDLSPLVANTGLRHGDLVSITGNPLNAESINTHIPELQSRQVRVRFDNIIIERPEDFVQPVNIPDPYLRGAIGSKLRKPRGEPITLRDMLGLTELFAHRRNISDLTGLEHAINLTELWLVNNNITDISPITGLTKLTELNLINNSISDISPLAGLTNLTELRLNNNSISDLSPLVANRGLWWKRDSVDVTGNPLNAESINTHIPTLQGREVTITFVPRGNIGPIVDIPDYRLREVLEARFGKESGDPITVAEMATLVHLYADTHYFRDVTGLEHATNLRTLNLRENFITDISPLAGLTNLTELDLKDNRLSDISPLAGLTNLTELNLVDNSISDISPLTGLASLIKLRLGANAISDISPLAGLNNVTVLDLGRNKIVDISLLAGLTNLITLYLGENTISDISALSGLTDLTQLFIWETEVSDISPLAGLTQLTFLVLEENDITDISALAELTNLTQLGLGHNSITDISPLARLTQLLVLGLSSNPMSDISVLEGLINLTQLWLGNNSISEISPLVANTGLGNGDIVDVRGNPLSFLAINTHIPLLLGRGVSVAAYNIVVRPEDLAQTVDIPDPNLRATIADARGKAAEDTITVADMLILIELKGINANISDLTGLEHATNLTELWFDKNSISEISTLAELTNLTWLSLEGNSISDLSPITGLTQLATLRLANNSISDFSPLVANVGLDDGDWVNVARNFLTDAAINTHIPALQSRGVTVDYDNIIVRPEDIAQTVDIPDPNLHSVIVDERGKAPGDTITVADMLILVELNADNANISDLTGLEAATNLKRLWLWDNNISDISPLAGLTQLTDLYLWNNSISDISPLAGLTELIGLHLQDNSISNISPLVENTGLGYDDFIDVRRNPLNLFAINTHIPTLQARWVTVEFDNIVAQTPDVNGDGNVNIFDLVSVAGMLGNEGQNLAEDVNADGIVNILDLVLVAGMFDGAAAAPSAQPQGMITAAAVRQWLADAQALVIRDPIMERGIVVLEQLLISLTPTETQLLPNYPNPFNPETWIPYRLAQDAFVTLTIYDQTGRVVRTIEIGHQTAAAYESRSRAIYWDGRNQVDEKVASGVYFYHLSADDYSATRKMLILK